MSVNCDQKTKQAAARAFEGEDDNPEELVDLGKKEDDVVKKIDAVLGKSQLDAATKTLIKQALVEAWKSENGQPAGGQPPAGGGKNISDVVDALQSPWTDTDKKDVKPAFDKKGWKTVADLGGSAQIPAKVDEVLRTISITPDSDKGLKLKAALEAAVERPITTSGALPTGNALPPGSVSLDGWPTLRAENAGSLTIFDVPAGFQLKAAPKVQLSSLTQTEWLNIAKNTNLTRALDIKACLAGEEDILAQYEALLWRTHTNFTSFQKTDVEAYVATTIAETNAYHSFLGQASLAVNYAFAEASVQASYELKQTDKSYAKRVTAFASYRRPQCWLNIRANTELSPVLSHLINLGLQKNSNEQIFDYFSQLFDLFGHIVPTKVLLGAQLVFRREMVSLETQSAEDTKTSVKVAGGTKGSSETKSGDQPAAGGSGNVGIDIGSGLTVSGASFFQNLTYSIIGGPPGTDGPSWWAGAGDPTLWDVLEREGENHGAANMPRWVGLPLSDWLDPVRKKRLGSVIDATSEKSWKKMCSPLALPADDFIWKPPAFQDFAKTPYFPQDHNLTLKNMFGSLDAITSYVNQNPGNPGGDRKYDFSKQGLYLAASNGVADVPDNGAHDDDGRDIEGKPGPKPAEASRLEGSKYTWCQPASLAADSSAGNRNKPADLTWRLLYTGSISAEGEPLYWIAAQDGQNSRPNWVLGAFKMPGYAEFACLYPFDEAVKHRELPSRVRWAIRRAIPPGRLKLPAPNSLQSQWFRIYNEKAGNYLADYAEFGSGDGRQYMEHIPGYYQALGPPLGGQVWVPPQDIDHRGGGPMFHRFLLLDVSLTSVFGQNYNATKELEQQLNYLRTVWLIQDRSDPEPREVFAELDKTYIGNLFDAYIAGKTLGDVPMP